MINDEDCEPPDEKQQDSPASPQEPSEFEFRVKLARAIPHIQKAFKTPVIAHGILQAIDEQLNNCLTVYPQSQPRLGDDLDLPLKTSLIYLQNKRLLLHRHNLSSASPPDSKSNAIERCMNVARETAQLLARMQEAPPGSMPSPNPENAWQSSLKKRSSAFLCLHLWRCTLFLAGAGEFEWALVCARASASLGKHRSVNSSCGRYLEFFLEVVSDKFQRGRVNFGDDDELLTYVSGDLQSSLDQAWIWQSGGDRALLTPDGDLRNGIIHGGGARDWDWNNWDKITNTLQRLAEEQMYRQKPATQQLSPNRDGSAGSFLAPRLETATAISPAQSVSPGGASNRMSIADLI